jgi:cephalosporin hydroxylase
MRFRIPKVTISNKAVPASTIAEATETGVDGENTEIGSKIITDETASGFTAKGVRFRLLKAGDVRRSTTDDEIVILKPASFLRKYDELFSSLPTANVVEIGIAEGGSLIYFALAFPQLRFVGIDLREPNEKVQDHIHRLGLQDRIKLYYRVDQADGTRIHRIIKENFGDEPIGAIIDDASHWYEQSKRTFETTFNTLAVGGTYCLEDWSWAHEPGRSQGALWGDKYSLSNLLFEIIMLQPSTGDIVRSIKIDRNVAFIEHGSNFVAHFNLDRLVLNRGKKLTLI